MRKIYLTTSCPNCGNEILHRPKIDKILCKKCWTQFKNPNVYPKQLKLKRWLRKLK